MYCAQCGTQVQPDQIYCSKCGYHLADALKPATSAQRGFPAPSATVQPSRVAQHLHVLAILWIVFSILRLIPGLMMLVFSHIHFPFMLMPIPAPARAFLMPMLSIFGLLVSGVAIAGVLAGWGLMTHQSWARMLTIVLACISLIHFPLGTALGVYTLWVLVPEGSEREYCRLAGNA